MNLSKQAVLEYNDLNNEARRWAAGSASDRKKADVLLQKCAIIRETGQSSDEMRKLYADAIGDQIHAKERELRAKHAVLFRNYVRSRSPQHQQHLLEEFRATGDAYAGSQSITYTDGASGGVLVPNAFYEEVTTGMAQVDPLLDADNVNLIAETGYAMRPKSLPGYDLTTIAAALLIENTNSGTTAFPVSSTEILNGYPFVLQTFASKEFDDDDFEDAMKSVLRAHGVGLARAIGQYLVAGSGVAQPSGLLLGASNSVYTTQAANVISATDINAIFFSVNRVYRNSPKCAWVMNDATYQLVRAAKDSADRPLIDMQDDCECLMGKKLLVSPSMPSGAGTKGIVFGDLSHFNVRCSALYFRKAWQAEFGIDSGRALHISRIRVDSTVFDPAVNASPENTTAAPIQYATLHS